MSSCFQSYFHCVFSTKHREKLVTAETQPLLYAYLGGIARKDQIVPIAIGGMPDHVHLLLAMPSMLLVPKAMNRIKGVSSRWLNEYHQFQGRFSWQEGYGAFTIGYSQINRTVAYIHGQERHHDKFTFEQEYMKFLKSHGVKFDPHTIWD